MTDASVTDFEIANRYLREEQYQKAVVFYQYAINSKNGCSRQDVIYENLGDALYNAQQPLQAEAAYEKAIELNPDLAYAHAQLGRIYFAEQRYRTAITALRQAIALSPTCVPFSEDLAQVLLEQAHRAQAHRAQAHRAQDYSLEASKVYKRLGAVLRKSGDFENAIASYHKAIELQPTLVDIHQAIGECYHLQGNFTDAAYHYQQVTQLATTPQHLWFYKNWGEALRAADTASIEVPPLETELAGAIR